MLLRWVVLSIASGVLLCGQEYDLVLRGGHVLDPGSGLDAPMDVAMSGGRIAAVAPHIAASRGRRSVDVTGLWVVPGLIDLHAHVFGYEGALSPDDTALPAGTTTVVDAGGSGWRTIEAFRRTVAAPARTRVLALINIVGAGMVGPAAENNAEDMDPAKTSAAISSNRDLVVGIKTAHFSPPGWTAIDRAVEAGRLARVPVMVDSHVFTRSGRTTREKLLDHLRPGDIHTHMFNDRQLEVVDRFSGKVQPYMLEARRRGVLLDLGHGAGSFLWPVAAKAAAQGFLPDTISTDLHSASIMMQQSDMPNCISKLMLLGMSLPDAILRSTVNPARAISRYPELGTLGAGRTADVAVLEKQTGVFALKDAWGAKRLAKTRVECVLTIRAGKIVYDRDARAFAPAAVELTPPAPAEIYDVLVKNGQVIDPANRRTGRFDVAVTGGKIARVAAGLRAAHARLVIDASDYYVTPGLIEIDGPQMQPDHHALRRGVTTVVGAPGGRHSKVRRLAKTAVTADYKTPLPLDTLSTGLSIFLNPGLTVEQVMERATAAPARSIRRPELGTLSEGAPADIALFALETGRFGYLDAGQARLAADRRLRCVLTMREGAVLWDSEGLTAPDALRAGPYSNFR